MAEKLRSRGPDDEGLYAQDGIVLGHRRLRILDLSAFSNQPMVDPELGLVVSFNGCIYNFRELREELIRLGFRFFSGGDTEVISKAYRAWGPRCVERFLGMFAFAVFDRENGRVTLARDRLGVKPLYYAELPGRFRFASTLPALLASGGIDTSLDPEALHHYMSFHAVVPAPMTILKGVRKLPPATILTIEPDGTRRQEVYWKLHVGAQPGDEDVTAEEWRAEVLIRLTRAIDRRRISDVPTGVFLSGGLDSSLVVALLSRLGPALKTFSVGFDRVDEVEGDEFAFSDLVARHFGTEHQKISVDAGRTLESLPKAIAAMSEPMMSHDAVGFYILSEEVSKSVKVVQSGQGADEVFGGYHWYPALMRSNDPVDDYSRLYFDRDHNEMKTALAPGLLNGDYSREYVERFFTTATGTPIDRTLQLDTEVMLVDDPVKRVDNMTMAFGLEARVPFLDHELVELAGRIPAELKVGNGGKYILKEAARSVVPHEVIDRKKGYFPVPALKYIRGPFLDYVRATLEDPRARSRGLFNKPYIDGLLSDPDRALTPKGHSKIWQVALLEGWLQAHGI